MSRCSHAQVWDYRAGVQVRGKGGTTSPRVEKAWADPGDPFVPSPDPVSGGTWPGAQGTGQAAVGLPLGSRAARASLSLWPDKPSAPLHLAGAREGRRQFQRSASWGKSPSPFSAPKRAPHSPQGPADRSLEGGWNRQQNFMTSCHPGHVPAIQDLVSTQLPTSAGRISSG